MERILPGLSSLLLLALTVLLGLSLPDVCRMRWTSLRLQPTGLVAR